MKKLLLIAFLLPALCMGQVKGDNVIMASGTTFKQVVNALLDKGFSIEKIDSNYNTVKTEWKEDAKYSFKVRYEVRVKDSITIIKGEMLTSSLVFEISNEKGAMNKLTFAQMNDFGKLLSTNLTYRKF